MVWCEVRPEVNSTFVPTLAAGDEQHDRKVRTFIRASAYKLPRSRIYTAHVHRLAYERQRQWRIDQAWDWASQGGLCEQ